MPTTSHTSLRPRITLSAGLLMSSLAAPLLHAQLTDRIWQGADEAVWSTGAHWSPTDTPNANTERAVINGTLDGGATVNLNGNYALGGLDIASGFTLTRAADDTANRTLTLNAATASDTTFNNAGTISTGGISGLLTINIARDAGTITNSGLIEATSGSELRIRSSNNNPLAFNNTGGTLSTVGTGILHIGTATSNSANITGGFVNNAGTINQSLRSTYTGVTVTNDGIYNVDTVTNTGNVWGINLDGDTAFTNSGTLNIVRQFTDDGKTQGQSNELKLISADATLANSGTINIIASGVAFTGSGGSAALTLNHNTEIVNTGTINLESRSTTQQARLYIATDVTATLSGTGELVLAVGAGGDVSQVAVRGTSTSELVNGIGHTIRGAGQLGHSSLGTLTNAGTIHADSATDALTIDLNGTDTTGTFTNSGTLRASGAGGMIITDGTTTNTGLIRVDSGSSLTVQSGVFSSSAGTIQVDGSLNTTPEFLVTGGTFTGQGSINGDVTIDGAVQFNPGGASAHVLTFENLAFSSAASERIIGFNFDHADARIDVSGALSQGLNNLFVFDFSSSALYTTDTIYTLITTGATDLLIDSLSISATSLSAGYELDTTFGSDGWLLSGNDLQVRFSGVAAAIPEPSQAALIFGLFGTAAALGLRRGRGRASA